MEPPQTHYTRSGDVHIAYQVLGEGALDLVYVSGLTQHVELVWETPQAPFLAKLSSLGRLIRFDKRGTGMSDRVIGSPTLETRMDDIRAVMDEVDSEKAVLIGYYDGVRSGHCSRLPIRSGRLLSFSSTLSRASFAIRNFPGSRAEHSTSDGVKRSSVIGATASGSRRSGLGHSYRAPRAKSSGARSATKLSLPVPAR